MGKASKAKRDGSSRQQRIAAQRAAARRAEIRNRILIVSGSVVVVIAVVLAFVLVKVNSNGSGKSSASASGPTGTALATVVKDTTTVPASTLDTVAGGTATAFPKKISGGSALTSNGKPEMLYMGAEYCPYCAAERWGMVVALSRFGTFKNLSTTHSSSSDEFPNTATWTFYKSSYTSKYLTFSSVEEETNQLASGGQSYTTLQTPTKAQQALLTKYDAPPYVSSSDEGAIPFVDFGNKYLISGSSYSPQVLQGKTWSQIATALKNPDSAIAKAVDGTANYITAAICELTGNQPASACTPAVKALEKKL
jgi:thiol-disulfide isomerase/thioredoxin